jgi:hypothetical protein
VHAWRSIWLFAAAASAAVLILFLLTFSDKEDGKVGTAEAAGEVPVEAPL